MLTCVYHPINRMAVVEDDEAEKLIASGVWFDSPDKAKQYLENVEREMKQESEAQKPKIRQPKGNKK
jgi:hypothetical protein